MYILKQKYNPPTRPYSQLELIQTEKDFKSKLGLLEKFIEFNDCCHFYLVKQGVNNTEKCGVCLKLKQTDKTLKDIANNLVNEYSSSFSKSPEKLSYDLIDLEISFYKWLYGK